MWRVVGVGAAILAAAVGVAWYVASPGVASYQVGGLLMLPALVLALLWLNDRLPSRVQWALALAIAPIGPVGYLAAGGSQWWNWGQLTVVPLFLLITLRRGPDGGEPMYGGMADGPWGPP